MDYIKISNCPLVREGLEDMLNEGNRDLGWMIEDKILLETGHALLIIEVAKLAEDKEKWFPRGKWATIQNMQAACDKQLAKLFNNNEQSI